MRKPSISTGALVGALLTAPLIAVLFLAGRLFGVPFVPFDIFDWLARVLPGAVVTIGIDLIVDVVTLLGLGLSEAAKAAEQALAVAIFLLTGVVVGAVLFGIYRARPTSSRYLPAVLLGLALGLIALLISLTVNTTATTSPLVSGIWILLAFVAWGAAFAWVHNRLSAPLASAAGSAAEVSTMQRLDRRRFLVRVGSATAIITVVGTGLGALLRGEGRGRLADGAPVDAPVDALVDGPVDAPVQALWSQRNPLPNAGAEVEPAPGTRPEFTLPSDHYRIDINLLPPTVDGAEWRLRVGGLVGVPREFTLDELRSYEAMHQFITLSCISNPLGGDLIDTTRWTGVSMQRLLPDLGLAEDATHLRISSVDDFYEYVSLETIEADDRVMLAYQWDGLPLPTENGYPLRIYIPDVYGMKQPKWIDRIEAVNGWAEGFWVERGWDEQAQVRSTSVIDTVAAEAPVSSAGGETLIPVGGIAFAGARGISRVEVQVDDGDWQEAQLREPLSDLTWVIWRYEWPFEEGQHTFTVRCFDGNGDLQIVERNPVRPGGATGLSSESVRL
ncbi:MAG: molybdopterin-dependent oxidoreductase [Trueperaceae bacterium]